MHAHSNYTLPGSLRQVELIDRNNTVCFAVSPIHLTFFHLASQPSHLPTLSKALINLLWMNIPAKLVRVIYAAAV